LNYLHFTKKERQGIIVLFGLILLIIISPLLYHLLFKEKISAVNIYRHEIDSLIIRQKSKNSKRYNNEQYAKKPDYIKITDHAKTASAIFYFDPNTISADDWKRLGVPDRTISTIQNFLSKNGRFKEPADIKKIWGLPASIADRLIPYIHISHTVSNSFVRKDSVYKENYPKKVYQVIDLTSTDSVTLSTLPGIGPRLSSRIITYRDKLGGFYSAAQVAETFDLPDSTFRKILPFLKLGVPVIKQLNINNVTLEELKSHPYIRYHLANSIIQYRNQHGNYHSVAALRNIMLVNDSIYNKIKPYLKVE